MSMNVFKDDYRYYLYKKKPWKIPKRILFNIKCAWQRITKGYCDKDTWDIRSWFLSVIGPMLKQYKKERHGSPACLGEDYVDENGYLCNRGADKAWDKILNEMLFYFREADEETCRKQNPYQKEYDRVWDEFTEKYGIFGEALMTEEEKYDKKGRIVHFPDEIPEYKEITEKYLAEDRKIMEYQDKCKDRAFELFAKYFWDLWD